MYEMIHIFKDGYSKGNLNATQEYKVFQKIMKTF